MAATFIVQVLLEVNLTNEFDDLFDLLGAQIYVLPSKQLDYLSNVKA